MNFETHDNESSQSIRIQKSFQKIETKKKNQAMSVIPINNNQQNASDQQNITAKKTRKQKRQAQNQQKPIKVQKTSKKEKIVQFLQKFYQYLIIDLKNNFLESQFKQGSQEEKTDNIFIKFKQLFQFIFSISNVILISYRILTQLMQQNEIKYEIQIPNISTQFITFFALYFFKNQKIRYNWALLLQTLFLIGLLIIRLIYLTERFNIFQFTILIQLNANCMGLAQLIISNFIIGSILLYFYYRQFILLFLISFIIFSFAFIFWFIDLKIKKYILICVKIYEGSQREKILAQVTHEIRGQINAILAYGQSINFELKKAQINLKQIQKLADKILKCCRFQQYIVSDYLDFNRMQKGAFKIIKQEFNINNITQDVIDLLKSNAEAKNTQIDLRYLINNDVIYNDVNRYQQIMINIIGNAIKFTKNGIVQIFMSHYKENSIKIEIIDNGNGIKKENLKKIGQEYQTFNDQNNSNTLGVGLGLSICNQFLQQMSWMQSFLVNSEEGVGTKFVFFIDLKKNPIQEINDKNEFKLQFFSEDLKVQVEKLNKQAKLNLEVDELEIQEEPSRNQVNNIERRRTRSFNNIQETKQQQPQQKRLNILMADDNMGNVQAVQMLISLCSDLDVEIVFETVVDGTQAVELFQKRNFTTLRNNIHMIIMDLNMDKLNGDLATLQIKQTVEQFGYIDPFIIGYSSDNEQAIIDSFMNKGADFFLQKPSSHFIFRELLENQIKNM